MIEFDFDIPTEINLPEKLKNIHGIIEYKKLFFSKTVIKEINIIQDIKGELLLNIISDKKKYPLFFKKDKQIYSTVDFKEFTQNLIRQNYFSLPGKGYFFNFNYHIIPDVIRGYLYKLFLNLKTTKVEVEEYNTANFLDDIFLNKQNNGLSAYLTFDIDTDAGLDFFLKITEILEKYNIKPTFFIPYVIASKRKETIEDLIKIKYEIGCHGYEHSSKLMFNLEKSKMECLIDFVKQYNIKGFRAPAYIITEKFFEEAKHIFKYDSSIYDIHFLNRNKLGIFTAMPLKMDGLKIIPINVFPDGLLLNLYKSKKDILRIYRQKLEYLLKKYISPVFVFHPEKHFSGNKKGLEIMEDLIKIIINEYGLKFSKLENI